MALDVFAEDREEISRRKRRRRTARTEVRARARVLILPLQSWLQAKLHLTVQHEQPGSLDVSLRDVM